MVYLSSSKFSLAVLGNLGFALALATYKLVLRASRPPPLPACLPCYTAQQPWRAAKACAAAAMLSSARFTLHYLPCCCRSSWAGCGTARWSG